MLLNFAYFNIKTQRFCVSCFKKTQKKEVTRKGGEKKRQTSIRSFFISEFKKIIQFDLKLPGFVKLYKVNLC